MSVFQGPKPPVGSIYPHNAVEASPLGRMEPLITPEQLRNRFLFGIPLVSSSKDPTTGRHAVMTDDIIKDIILGAVDKVEQHTGINIYPVLRHEKHPFDRYDWNSFGHFMVKHPPILELRKVSVTPSNGTDIYIVPLDWVESANFVTGQINIVPMTIANIGGVYVAPTQTAGGAQFFNILGMQGWIPAFWQIDYVSGFEEGKIPRVVNDLIGIYAAIEILGQLSTTNRQSNYALGIDGLNQSVATPGVQVYSERVAKLEEQKVVAINNLKKLFNKKIFVGVI